MTLRVMAPATFESTNNLILVETFGQVRTSKKNKKVWIGRASAENLSIFYY